MKKGFWKIGRIENLIKGQDDLVRGAELRIISSRGKKPLVIKRPLQSLFPPEVNGSEAVKREELKKEAKSENEPVRSLPKRSAAVIGELKRRYQSTELDSV